jgi:hypothetical protein
VRVAKEIKSPYSGALLEFLPRRKRFGTEIQEDPDWDTKHRRRFDLLLKHYDIDRADPAMWANLACDLIYDHVPGLREVKAPGRPKKFFLTAILERADLLREIDAIKEQYSLSDTAACEQLLSNLRRHRKDHEFAGKSVAWFRKELKLARQEDRNESTKRVIELWTPADPYLTNPLNLGAQPRKSLPVGATDLFSKGAKREK